MVDMVKEEDSVGHTTHCLAAAYLAGMVQATLLNSERIYRYRSRSLFSLMT